MIVLVISSLKDGHVGPVVRELSRRRGIQAEVLDHSRFPSELSISAEFGSGLTRLTLGEHGLPPFNLDEVGAVWWRRPQPFGTPSGVTDNGVARLSTQKPPRRSAEPTNV